MRLGRGEGVHESIIDGDNEDLASAGELGVGDEAGDVRVGAGWAWGSIGQNCTIFEWQLAMLDATLNSRGKYSLNAAGTPMMRPLPFPNSAARSTVLSGAPSTRGMLGMLSPAWTILSDLLLDMIYGVE